MDGRSDLVMCCAVFTTLCRALGSQSLQFPYSHAASQDTLGGASVKVAEYPGVHTEPLQSTEEEEPFFLPLQQCWCDVTRTGLC